MALLKGTLHGDAATRRRGDAANNLVAFYQEQSERLAESQQYFMAAVALALAMEAVILTYFLIHLDEERHNNAGIPSSVSMAELIAAANKLDILNVPIGTVPLEGLTPLKHVAKDVVNRIRVFRNLIHPARALKENFDPRVFTRQQYGELEDIYGSVYDSLLHHL